ncbi:MAG: hypothetical protein ACE5JB_12775 [bacterium]
MFTIFLYLACADRDRINPIDPQNPNTVGRPTGVKVISIQDTVFLSWNLIVLKDLSGYKIYRKTSFESEFLPLTLVPPNVNSFKDIDIVFNIEYSYQISAVGPTYESLRSDIFKITPGPTFNWVADNLSRQLVKLTHDAQHEILRSSGFQNLIDIETNPNNGDVWVIDRVTPFLGELIRISPEGQIKRPILQFTTPVDVALEINTAALWVADSTDNIVVKIDSAGTTLFTIDDFSNPLAVSIDQRTGDCWVADSQLERISKIKADGTKILTSSINFIAVQSVTVNSSTGDVWVADSSRIVKLDETGNLSLGVSERFNNAYKIEVNENTGEVWILNLIYELNQSTISKFSATGQKIFEIDGFTIPEDLSINLFDNSSIVADTQNNRIVRISDDGKLSGVFKQIGFPSAVCVQNQLVESNSN